MESNPEPAAATEITSTQEQPWTPMLLRRRPDTTSISGSPPEDSSSTSTEEEAAAHGATAPSGDAGTDPPAAATIPDGYTAADLVEAVAYHFVFVVDRSGSMGIADVTPRPGSKFAASRKHNNRLGCTYDAILHFVQTRLGASQNADLVSVVLFDDTAEVAVEGRPIRDSFVDELLDYAPGFGTRYSQGLNGARSVIQRVARREDGAGRQKHPFIVFLSDGGNTRFAFSGDVAADDPVAIIQTMVTEDDPRLVVNTIQFGTGLLAHQVKLLRDMAAAGSGTRTVGEGEPAQFCAWREVLDTNTTVTRGDDRGSSTSRRAGRWSQGRSSGVYHMSSLNRDDLYHSFEILAENASTSGENRSSRSERRSPGAPEPEKAS